MIQSTWEGLGCSSTVYPVLTMQGNSGLIPSTEKNRNNGRMWVSHVHILHYLHIMDWSIIWILVATVVLEQNTLDSEGQLHSRV